MRSNISSAVAGNEGLFNLGIQGSGVVCLESMVPKEELIEITLKDDVLKIDGNMAIAWSDSLDFTVEKSTRSLLGSAVAEVSQKIIRDRLNANSSMIPFTQVPEILSLIIDSIKEGNLD